MGLQIVIEDAPVWAKNYGILSIPPEYSFVQRLLATGLLISRQFNPFKLSILHDIKIYADVAHAISTKATQVVLDLTSLFKETTLFLL